MSSIDGIFSFFTSIVGMISLVVTLGAVGVLVYFYKYSDATSKGTVILFRTRDKRAEFIPIEKEEEFIIKCREKDKILRRFVKAGNGWVIKKKNFFLGVEGSGYTAIVGKPEMKPMPLQDALKEIWGDKFYEKIPEARITQLVNANWIVNIEPVGIDPTEAGLPRLSAEDLNDREDTIVLEKLAKSVEATKPKMDMMMMMLAGGCGAGIMLLAVAMKWVVF